MDLGDLTKVHIGVAEISALINNSMVELSETRLGEHMKVCNLCRSLASKLMQDEDKPPKFSEGRMLTIVAIASENSTQTQGYLTDHAIREVLILVMMFEDEVSRETAIELLVHMEQFSEDDVGIQIGDDVEPSSD